MCGCGKGNTVLVAYVFRGERRSYSACSRCDLVDFWPNFSRTAPSGTGQ